MNAPLNPPLLAQRPSVSIFSDADSRGYTLVEMLLVIGVVAMLATIVTVQFVQTRQRMGLNGAQRVVSADVRQTLQWAQAGRTQGGVVPQGYGVVFTVGSPTYTVYASFDGDASFSGADTVVDAVDLLNDEQIDDVVVYGCAPLDTATNTCDLFIAGPSGTVYTNGKQVDDLKVVLQHLATGAQLPVSVSLSTGRIDL